MLYLDYSEYVAERSFTRLATVTPCTVAAITSTTITTASGRRRRRDSGADEAVELGRCPLQQRAVDAHVAENDHFFLFQIMPLTERWHQVLAKHTFRRILEGLPAGIAFSPSHRVGDFSFGLGAEQSNVFIEGL